MSLKMVHRMMSNAALHAVGMLLGWNCILLFAAACHITSKVAAVTTVMLNVATINVHKYLFNPI